jgi:hypothetical protein
MLEDPETSPLLARPGNRARHHRKLLLFATIAVLALCGIVYAGQRAQSAVVLTGRQTSPAGSDGDVLGSNNMAMDTRSRVQAQKPWSREAL